MAFPVKRLLNPDYSSVESSRQRTSEDFIRLEPDDGPFVSFNDDFHRILDNSVLDFPIISEIDEPGDVAQPVYNPGESIATWGANYVADPSPTSQSATIGIDTEFQYTPSRSVTVDIDGNSHENPPEVFIANEDAPEVICYGMIYNADVRVVGDMSVLDEKLRPKQTTTLIQRFKLQAKRDHILLSFDDETEFGFLRVGMTKGLTDLITKSTLQFEAVAETESLRETIGKAQKPADALVRVSINIYGPPSEADDVGSDLSKYKLWLQKPDHPRRGVVYKNPQVLEFEGIDLTLLDKPSELVQKSQPKIRSNEDHLRQTVSKVYQASKRQDGLRQMTSTQRFKTKLLKHQREALDFMLQRESGNIPDEFRLWKKKVVNGLESYHHSVTKSKSRTRPEEKGGGILADEMGMGKSLSILSLIIETLEDGQRWAETQRLVEEPRHVKAHTPSTLIVVSSALLINNWLKEIDEHLEDKLRVIRYHGKDRPKGPTGLTVLENSDIVITTYNTLAKEYSDKVAVHKPSILHNIAWYRVVLDEAHIIRRESTSFHRTCAKLNANSRWCLTGTPIQNRLEDIGALFCFIRARPFDGIAMFRRYIEVPFSQHDDDTAVERLSQLVESLCLRRNKVLLHLPDLIMTVRELDMNEAEMTQYNKTKEVLFRKIRQKAGEHRQSSKFGLFQAQLQLRIMCNHGTFQQPFSWQSQQSLRDVREAAISALGGNTQVVCDGCSQAMPVLGSNKLYNEFVRTCHHVLCSECVDETAERDTVSGRWHCPMCTVIGIQSVDVHMAGTDQALAVERREVEDARYFREGGYSTKMQALITDVQTDLENTKSIIFSCWTRTLNLVATHLEKAAINFSRIDGECPLSKRQKILDDFAKDSGNPVLIMTTGTGAFGLNLTCANRVFIVELQWNPSVESQAIARAIRLGQNQRVKVIRYIMKNTVEQEMSAQQQRKLRMVKRGFEEGTS